MIKAAIGMLCQCRCSPPRSINVSVPVASRISGGLSGASFEYAYCVRTSKRFGTTSVLRIADDRQRYRARFRGLRKELKGVRVGDHVTDQLQYTHSILDVVYQTYQEIEYKYGSIRNLTTEEIVAKLIQGGLAPQTARRCADILDEVKWHKAQLPLRHWLESIRDFYCRPRLCTEMLAPALRSVAPAAS